MNTQRKVERKNFNNQWEEIDFSELKSGDIFRMFEPTGEPVEDEKHRTEFLATTKAFIDEETFEWTVNIWHEIQ